MNSERYLRKLTGEGRCIKENGVLIFEVWQARQVGSVVQHVLSLGGDITLIERSEIELRRSERYAYRTAYFIYAVVPTTIAERIGK